MFTNMIRLTLYKTAWCGYCADAEPIVQQEASRLGLSMEIVDVEKCPIDKTLKCSTINAVPHLELDGREISLEELKRM